MKINKDNPDLKTVDADEKMKDFTLLRTKPDVKQLLHQLVEHDVNTFRIIMRFFHNLFHAIDAIPLSSLDPLITCNR